MSIIRHMRPWLVTSQPQWVCQGAQSCTFLQNGLLIRAVILLVIRALTMQGTPSLCLWLHTHRCPIIYVLLSDWCVAWGPECLRHSWQGLPCQTSCFIIITQAWALQQHGLSYLSAMKASTPPINQGPHPLLAVLHTMPTHSLVNYKMLVWQSVVYTYRGNLLLLII